MDANRIKNIPIECLSGSGPAIATNIARVYPYVNGEPDRTQPPESRVDVVFPSNSYERQSVRVKGPVDALAVALDKANGRPVYVNFTGFTARVYMMNGRVGVTARADGVEVVPDTSDVFDLGIS